MDCANALPRMSFYMSSNVKTATRLRRRHSDLCFERAFPRSKRDARKASDELGDFALEISRQQASISSELIDSGIAGTAIRYRFSFEVAKWLAGKAPGAVSIDWPEIDDTEPLDSLLRHVLLPAEDEYFDSGYASTREWVDTARSGCGGTDFEWLMAQLQERRCESFYRQLFDAADVPLIWNLGNSPYSKSRNVFGRQGICMRKDGMRPRPHHVKKEITRPVENISKLPPGRGADLLDVAIASLAARHRETYHFNFANPDEVYVADLGNGIGVAVFGLSPAYRFPLECTMGFLILSNGVPIGYGGSSVLFKQVNTGINIFDEYRGSEAAYLWVQVMRVYHSLVGCTRYVANPYQLGSGNREALRSGAFWFYYRLGYRSVKPNMRRLALDEQTKMKRDSGYRSDLRTLGKLASCDMHLTLPGAKQTEFFDEDWLPTSSGLATTVLGRAGGKTRRASASRVARDIAGKIGVESLQSWTPNEQRGFRAIAPFVAALQPEDWTTQQKRAVRRLLKAKGGRRELEYARLLAANDWFLQALRAACIAWHKAL